MWTALREDLRRGGEQVLYLTQLAALVHAVVQLRLCMGIAFRQQGLLKGL